MGCPICRDLERNYAAGLSEYIEARSSAYFQISKQLAARNYVDMERARYELEEHRLGCVCAGRGIALLSELEVTTSLRQLAA
jgi:hypothetical protein